jgi:lysozyme family protein
MFKARAFFNTVPTTDVELEDMILAHEGSRYTDHPLDRGGPTRWGITIPVLSLWRGAPVTAEDIRDLTREEAARIYNRRFIRPFEALGPTLLRANVIDMSVNSGIARGVKLLQQTTGAVVDGVFGPATADAARTREDFSQLYTGVRLAFYERLIENNPGQKVFRNGWRARALSFYGFPRTRMARPDGTPVFGFVGKAYE